MVECGARVTASESPKFIQGRKKTAMIDDQLRYFVVVAKHEHLGRAAEALDLSQPALSRSIARLEQEFDVRLFERAGRRIQLNAAGRVLLKHGENALA